MAANLRLCLKGKTEHHPVDRCIEEGYWLSQYRRINLVMNDSVFWQGSFLMSEVMVELLPHGDDDDI